MNLTSSKCQALEGDVQREIARVDAAKQAYADAVAALAAIDVQIEERMQTAAEPTPALRRALHRELQRDAAQLLVEDLAAELAAIYQVDERRRVVMPRVEAKRKLYHAQIMAEDTAWCARATAAVTELIDKARHHAVGPDFEQFVADEILGPLLEISWIEHWWAGTERAGAPGGGPEEAGFVNFLRAGPAPPYQRPPTPLVPKPWQIPNPRAAAQWILKTAQLHGLNGGPPVAP
jgi:hypothetical protein